MSYCRVCQGEHRPHASRGVAAPLLSPPPASLVASATILPGRPLTEKQLAYFAARLIAAGYTVSVPASAKKGKAA